MLEHHLQKQMLHTLVKSKSARFADLRPKNVDSNLATYHLQQLVKQGLITKQESGLYSLTAEGKIVGTTVTLSKQEVLYQAHSVLLLAARNKEGAWLLRKRLAQPMYGKSGFVHGEPVAGEHITETAAKVFKAKTNLEAEFLPRGSGYITLMDGDKHQSFIHFTLLLAESVSGELASKVGNGENYWYVGDFEEPDMIPSMSSLIATLSKVKDHFYLELTY